MNERRRIIIPTGADPDEPLPSPHFDTEATRTARPVVPLSEQETFQINQGAYQGAVSRPFWKQPGLLAVVLLIAVGVGVGAGFAISILKNRQAANVPADSSLPPTGESTNPGPVAEQAAEAKPSVTVDKSPAEVPPLRDDETREDAAGNEPKHDNEVAPPIADRAKSQPADDDTDAVIEARRAEQERRREERRERRRRQREEDETIDIPRQVDRAGREINSRIREIFEGKQP